jgi:hypothetical protein
LIDGLVVVVVLLLLLRGLGRAPVLLSRFFL